MAACLTWRARGWSANTGRASQRRPPCTWTRDPLRSRPVRCSLERTTNQSSPAQVRMRPGVRLALSQPYPAARCAVYSSSLLICRLVSEQKSFPLFAAQKAPKPLLRKAPPRPPGCPPCLRYDSDSVSKCLTRAALFTCLLFPSDHLTVSVAIKVNGTSVVSGSFIIYDCERTGVIHPKTP